MKRRRILLLLALAAVAAAIALFWPRGPKEPVYHGKRLSEWIKQKSSFVEAMTNADVDNAISSIGTNALPWLISEFTRPRSKWRTTLNRWASALSVVDFQLQADEERVQIAMLGLCFLGPDAAPALPTVARYLDDPDRGPMAMAVIAQLGDRASPWLLIATASTNWHVAREAMNVLFRKAHESEPALRALVALHRHTNSDIRMMTAVMLRRFDKQPDLTVPALVAALADPEPEVQSLASFSLSEMGTNAQPAIPALLRLMTSTNTTVASAASNAVFRIDPAALPVRGP